MKFSFDLSQHSKSLLSDAIKIYLPTCLFIIVVWLIAEACGIGMYELTADPAEVARKPPYTGLFSHVGNLLWCGTAAICIFTGFLIKVDPVSRRRWLTFLLASFCHQYHDYEDDDDEDDDEQEYEEHRDRSRTQVRQFGDYDEAEERWHLHRHDIDDKDEEQQHRDQYRDEGNEFGDYDEAEERWNL